jgi:UPF0755 protein
MMRKILTYLFYIILTVCLAGTAFLWIVVFKPNVKSDTAMRIYLPSGSSFENLIDTLRSTGALRNERNFLVTARLKSFDRSLKSGSYIIDPGMNNSEIVNMLRSGLQAPVNVTFNNIRTLDELAAKVGSQIEADPASLSRFFDDENNYSADGFTRQTLISVFLPDTYQLYWNLDPKGFYRRMLREYNAFWNDERLSSAKALNLTPVEVSTLASIIEEEVAKDDEMPRIAGVYLNRLRKGIPLQADPTVKFAVNDFTIRRVLNEHLEVDSPYNTYKYSGLPPGPVRCASKPALEAVLKAEKHDYLFFVAKADFSGYHHFSRTLSEHNRYAAAYRRELNKRRIYQ